MFITTNIQCPYCERNNKVDVEITGSRNIAGVHFCKSCERDFALFSTLKISSFMKCIDVNKSEEKD